MRLLITGGCGFIGSTFIKHIIRKYNDYSIINLDLVTYAGNLENLDQIKNHPKYTFVKGDIADENLVKEITRNVDAVINFAAESHVDRSIEGPSVFIRTNVLGTQVLLESAKENKVQRFIQISTDEVYGSLGPEGYFRENSPLLPNSPYSASKAGADLIVRSYFETYKFPSVITRCSNNYGSNQFPEKFIPLLITNAFEDKEVPVYGDGLNVRDWIHVKDHCKAIDAVLHKGKVGETYNIGGNCEKRNIDIAKLILKKMGKDESLIRFVKDRPGHDRRYAIDASRIRKELGWSPEYNFDQGISETIKWYDENRSWWLKIKSGEYMKYYERMYGNR
ncbi:MAG: dTDP-glucose 4,6-dehydratase [Candidatus Schekmanbacteria bacterium GWA2_38_11]|uniref:dTDP-glucose 4,6-dehydratase n=1 Tax=Candidatus Schekmanbacteria bacterium GWA2_38_11 TaxID=1817876 RepID=A0A1F7RIY7_9BACT|nr:MAG: dTDP-glucose 4,6-dehydratase [Candidatus Schekmanbacteria bacterium GWA2_38_11]